MMGIFVQVNENGYRAESYPLGYVLEENGCWTWVGNPASTGYGRWETDGEIYAHRVMYRRAKGSIPRGQELDHLCRNRLCVNPDHLEAVTKRENILRGMSPSAHNARRTHCVNGHRFDPANTRSRLKPNGRRDRVCRMCHRLKMQGYRLKGRR